MVCPDVLEDICKELELSYIVVEREQAQLDQVFKVFRDMGQSLANAILWSFQRLSCKGIHRRERIFAGSCIGEGCLR